MSLLEIIFIFLRGGGGAKIKPQGFPEYIGYWVVGANTAIPPFKTYDSHSSFRMFIDSKKNLGDSIIEIKGRMKDNWGRAKFKGMISPTKVSFTKRYELKHSDLHAFKSDIFFEGTRNKARYYDREYYEGLFKAQNDQEETILFGSFVLEKYSPSLTLEFLMRNDERTSN